jgi:hypothetical protein
MAKVHAQGGHGHYFKEQREKAARMENAAEKIKRAQEARQRQITAQVKREVELVGNKFELEIVPALTRVRINLEQRARSGALSKEAFIIRVLAIDEFSMNEIKKRMQENETIKSFTKDIDFSKYRPLSASDRSELLTQIIGKKPTVPRQRSVLMQIQQLSKEVPRWALSAGI